MHEDQYPIVAARRQAYDTLLWQVPTFGVAAQGFLVSAALDAAPRLSASLLLMASIVGLAVAWLFRRLRFHEVADSELLKTYEAAHPDPGFAVVHGRRAPGLSAYRLWLVLLVVFVFAEMVGTIIMLWKIIG